MNIKELSVKREKKSLRYIISKLSTHPIIVSVAFAVLTAIAAQISVPIPFSPVPISFGLVAVYISGILQKPKYALSSQLSYLAAGAMGAPVFSGFRGGIAALFGPTGGYLFIYPIMAWIVSMTLNSRRSLAKEGEESKGWTLFKAGTAICIAQVVLYLGGTMWLKMMTGTTFYASLVLAVFPFVPLDIVKVLFCIFVMVPSRSSLMKNR